MAARKNTSSINLLPKEEFNSSTLGRFLSWALSTFRIIVIITELLVMGAFLSRFWLDARSNDLNDLIREKESVIAATSDFEKEFKDVQKRLKIFSAMGSQNASFSSQLTELSKYLPIETSLSSISFQENSLQIKGLSSTEIGIGQFMSNLEQSKNFKNILLQSISLSPQDKSQIVFAIKMDHVGKGGNQ